MFRKKGFTLLELIIVIIVIGILASIALPRYLRVAERGRMAEGISLLGSLRSAQMRYQAQYGNFTVAASCSNLDLETTQPKYFPVASWSCSNVDPIVTVTRSTLDAGTYAGYVLGIREDGIQNCTGTNCPANL